MDKKKLTETDIRSKFITPALTSAGWNLQSQIREEVALTNGKILVRGQRHRRGQAKYADYILYYKPNIPVAVIEAKDNRHTMGAGMQQALNYSEMHGELPFVFSSNGDGFLFHDRTGAADDVEREIALDEFPSPDELWAKYCAWKNIGDNAHEVVEQDYYIDQSGKTPRYYQLNAINKTIEAIARGQTRILLVMATGVGKTYTAFQIIWRLWKSRRAKRILFLVDRNILADQAKTNDFKPFGNALTKIQNRQADKSYEVYLALYQGISGVEEDKNIYKQFSPDFFDLIVIDECHRGSAREDAAWHEILKYFDSAIHIGLTATPKETKDVSNITYFGDPVYTYSLKQGIDDGFLAPYKVVRIDLDKDLFGWRPESGQVDSRGEVIDDRIYNQSDMDRNLVLAERTKLVAQKVTEFLHGTNRMDKTIVFCEDVDHAERMRQALVNANPDLASENRKYVMRITGDDAEGKAELDNFIDPESDYPVIATTSELMTTGVDAQTCKLIVLDQSIKSMTKFKQVIGRGTRINEEHDKFFFTILDFKKATELFADPDFDGEPVVVYEPRDGQSPVPPDEIDPQDGPGTEAGDEGDDPDWGDGGDDVPPGRARVKYYVDGVAVSVIAERIQYYGPDGKLITESLKDYTRKTVHKTYASLTQFLQTWTTAGQKKIIIEELEKQGVLFDALKDDVGKDYDAFDLICHVVFDQPPLTRQERAESVRKRNYFTKYGDDARIVLEALLDKYADGGIKNIEDLTVLKVPPLSELGTPHEILRMFGGRNAFQLAIQDLETGLYSNSSSQYQ